MTEPELELLKPEEVAARLRISTRQVLRLVNNGSLTALRLSKKVTRIHAESLDAYIERSSTCS